jgi:hypothetical protein
LRRNCVLKHIIEGKIAGTGRRGRRRTQLLDDLKEKKRSWNLKGEHSIVLSGELALDERVARQTGMDE